MQGTVTKKRKLNSDNSETQSRKKYKKKARIQQPADEQRLQVELETLNEQLAKIEEQMKQKKEEIEAELGNDVIAIDDDITPNQGEDTTEGVERRSGRSVRPKRASRPTRQFAELEVGEGAVGKTGPVPSTATKTNVASPQQQQQPRSRYQPVYDPPKWDRILPVVEKSIPKKVKNLWGKSPMIVCKNILKELLNQKNSYWFAEPVDPVALNIPDYFDIIKKPMDLGTINKRMSTYTTVLDFANDVRLVISNALSYNAPGHEVYLAAQSLSKFFEKSIKRAFDMEKETPDLKKQQLERDVRTLKSEKSKLVKQLSQLKETKPSARLDTEVVDESPLIKPKDEVETSPMNYGERCQLCNAINGLQDKYMRGLVTIVADENPVLLKAGVSELDIDTLSTILLRRMEAYIDSCKAKDVEILNKAKNVQEKKGEDMTESKNHQPQSPVTLVKEESSSSSSSSSSDSSSDSDEDEDLPISNKPVLMMQSTPGNNGASLLESNKPDSIGASVGSPVLKEPGFHNQPVKEEKKVEVLNVDAWSSLEKESRVLCSQSPTMENRRLVVPKEG